jgi:8-oxo-dGTP diphosphatase
MTERFRPFAAIGLILIKNSQILLMRRYNTGYQDGSYSLIAGHLNGHETTKQCAVREAKEEANIDIDNKDLDVLLLVHRFKPDREYFDIYLTVQKWSGEIKNMEPEKCDDIKWFSLENMPHNLIPELRPALENIKNGVHYAEFGWDC